MANGLYLIIFMSMFKLSQCQVELTGSDIAFEGEKYVLTCHIAANEGTRYYWYRNEVLVARSGSNPSADGDFCGMINNNGSQRDRYELNCQQHQLTIKSVDSSEDGVSWKCHNFRYSITQNPEYGGTLTIKTGIPATDVSISFPSYTHKLINNTLQIQNGSNLLIGCQPNNDASPAPDIRLYYIKNTFDILKRTTGDYLETSLTVTMEMNGSTLYCKANNSKRVEISTYIKMQVLDPTTMSLHVNNVTDNKIILQCKVDGRPNNYIFSPWKHYLDGVLIREVEGYLENGDNSIYYLNIPTQLYKNRGVYVCTILLTTGNRMIYLYLLVLVGRLVCLSSSSSSSLLL
ncbi:uncharacterized protein LOC126830402 [Patella vulgata]|uniref:uncharacterized protein LOC126830402 n=1 Tax=Patella vulgata TaxID=6465 RepID=UPI0024A96061|nr:uncharacterized protein LOC126830402 [Patella vulgata]